MGNRFKGGIAPGAMPCAAPLPRQPGADAASAGCSSAVPIGDFHCGLRGFRRDAIRDARPAHDRDGVRQRDGGQGRARRACASPRCRPTLRPDGRSRPPHLRSWRDGWRHLRFLLLFSPRWLFLYPGLALVAVAATLMAVLATGLWSPGHGRLAEGLLVGAGGLMIVGVQALQFSLLARVFAETQRLLPPMRRRVSGLVDRITMEIGLVGGSLMVLSAAVGLVLSLLLSRSSDPHADAATVAFRLGTFSVVLGVLGLQFVLGATFLSLLRLHRLGDTASK